MRFYAEVRDMAAKFDAVRSEDEIEVVDGVYEALQWVLGNISSQNLEVHLRNKEEGSAT